MGSGPIAEYGRRLVADESVSEWIAKAFDAGHHVQYLLDRLVQSGWSRGDAKEALRCTLCPQYPAANGLAVTEITPPAPSVPVPGPAQLQVPFIALDRPVRVLMSIAHPRIVLFGNLLSAEECEALIGLARERMSRSRTVDYQTGEDVVHEARTSQGMFFGFAKNEWIARLEQRIARLLNWPIHRGEGLQVLRYGPGAEYRPHFDYFPPDKPGSAVALTRSGQRVGSLVIYLNEPEAGGGTVFPDAGVEINPQRGNAVFFSYDRPDPSTKTLHGGAPVIAGEKWVATKWLRAGDFWQPPDGAA